MDIFWVRVIIGVIIFLLIFGESIQRATRGINPTGWHMPTLPQANWRFILASLGGIAVLALFFATESTLAFFEVMLYSKIFWALLIAIIVFRSILTDNWGWFNGTVRWVIAILLAIWIFGGIRSCGSSKPGTGGNSGTTTPFYKTGEVIFEGKIGSTPKCLIIPCKFALTYDKSAKFSMAYTHADGVKDTQNLWIDGDDLPVWDAKAPVCFCYISGESSWIRITAL